MELTRDNVRAWLIGYAWVEKTQDQKERVVDCILSQGGWELIDARADRYAGAQESPGPDAFAEGVQFELSALYECHDGPHLPTCPMANKNLENHDNNGWDLNGTSTQGDGWR
jgi:hypothetical protein